MFEILVPPVFFFHPCISSLTPAWNGARVSVFFGSVDTLFLCLLLCCLYSILDGHSYPQGEGFWSSMSLWFHMGIVSKAWTRRWFCGVCFLRIWGLVLLNVPHGQNKTLINQVHLRRVAILIQHPPSHLLVPVERLRAAPIGLFSNYLGKNQMIFPLFCVHRSLTGYLIVLLTLKATVGLVVLF